MAHASPTWKFILANSSDLSAISDVQGAWDKTLNLIHNRSGNASLRVRMDDPIWSGIEPIKHCIIAYRNAVPMWSGPIWTMEESLPENRMTINAAGWFELLHRRVLRQDVAYGPLVGGVPSEITGGAIVFDAAVGTPGTAGYYPGGLLTQANAQRSTWITAGSNDDQMLRKITFERGQNIGEAITSLTDIEAGFDFKIDPLTRVMTITNWDAYNDLREEVTFGYNWGPSNLQSFGRVFDSSTMLNRMTAMGSYGGGLAEDIDSQNDYQLFEEITSLSEVVDPNVLLGYAGAEVVLRRTPRVVYSIAPFPWVPGRTPEPFADYNVGDMVSFTAKHEPRVSIQNQAVRIFGMSVNITNEGNEKISSLQITPGG